MNWLFHAITSLFRGHRSPWRTEAIAIDQMVSLSTAIALLAISILILNVWKHRRHEKSRHLILLLLGTLVFCSCLVHLSNVVTFDSVSDRPILFILLDTITAVVAVIMALATMRLFRADRLLRGPGQTHRNYERLRNQVRSNQRAQAELQRYNDSLYNKIVQIEEKINTTTWIARTEDLVGRLRSMLKSIKESDDGS